MIAIGLTGGIGSGKSTVDAMLEQRGAIVIETDKLARAALEPGGAGFAATCARFPDAVAQSGEIDRRALARVVFSDPEARRDLEAIVHPAVRAAVLDALEARRDSGDVVIVDVPLFVETGGRDRYPVSGVLVIDTPVEVAIERLTSSREMTAEEARERIATQASRADRIAAADYVIVNVGDLVELEVMVGRAWDWIEQLAAELAGTPGRDGSSPG